MYRLVCAEQGQDRLLHETNAALTLIGRSAQAALRLQADGVAERHALIERRSNGYYICDLGSLAGVRVNHHLVKDQRLVSGDEIELAAVRFRFEVVYPPTTGRARDGLQLLAAVLVGLLVAGEVALVVWTLAQPRSRQMRKETSRSIRLAGRGAEAAIPTGGTVLATTPSSVLTSTVAQPPPVLNRMLKIVRMDRKDATNSVTLRVNIRAQVAERDLDVAAVKISVQWLVGTGPAGGNWLAPVWLPLPAPWENFSAQIFNVQWDGAPQQLQGGIVRTYYRDRLQDQAVWPPHLTPVP